MSAQKFKIGDRVRWKDYEGRARSGVITEAPHGNCAADGSFYVKEAQELPPGRWHESHLSPDVPEGKKYATDLEVQLGAEIINLHYAIAEQGKEIWRLTRINTKNLYEEDALELSNRLTKEIGGRHRERIAKEAAQADARRLAEGNKWVIDALSAEARAKEAAQKELADVRKDLADLRTISKRLAL